VTIVFLTESSVLEALSFTTVLQRIIIAIVITERMDSTLMQIED
jgi:hypothetical protein